MPISEANYALIPLKKTCCHAKAKQNKIRAHCSHKYLLNANLNEKSFIQLSWLRVPCITLACNPSSADRSRDISAAFVYDVVCFVIIHKNINSLLPFPFVSGSNVSHTYCSRLPKTYFHLGENFKVTRLTQQLFYPILPKFVIMMHVLFP